MPDWRRTLRELLAGLPPARVDEIAAELAQHLEDRYAELVAEGVPEPEAQRATLRELESSPALRDELQRVERPATPPPPVLGEPGRGGLLSGLGSDVSFGLRALGRTPGVTAVALLTLSLAIGANAAIFSIVDAVLLRPLPFAEPDRLVSFWGSAPEMGIPVLNYPDAFYVYFRTRSRALSPVVAYTSASATLTGVGEPERLNGAWVTADFFRLLGQAPQEGRGFLPEEEAQGRNLVAVLSDTLWRRRFGGDPRIVGKALTLDGQPVTVVGVMPEGFDFPNRAELWRPLPTDPTSLSCWCFSTLGRLREGRTPKDAAREIARLTDDFWSERKGEPPLDPKQEPKAVVRAAPLARTLVGDTRTPVLVLLGAVVAVLLIACANVANLLLARATARAREIGVRCCLGASPWRIVRQLLVESLLLALGGAAIGLTLALFAVRGLRMMVVQRLPHLHDVGLDARMVGFTMGVTIVTAVLFGLAPAVRGARVDLRGAVKEGARAGGDARSRRLRDSFVVAQVALSLVLLAGAGLLLRSFQNLRRVDLGFRPENVLVARVTLPYDEPAKGLSFYAQLGERLRGLPGLRAVGLSTTAPFSEGGNGQIFTIRGREPRPDQPKLVAEIRVVTPGYFAAMGTPLVRGRLLDETDTGTSAPAAVVDETLARRFWPDGNAVGHQVRLGEATDPNPWVTIVGVVGAVKISEVAAEPVRHIYLPLSQNAVSSMDVVVRAEADPAALSWAVRREVQALDPTLPVYAIHTLEGAVARSLGPLRLTNQLLLAFALCALLLAGVGLYGVMALGVSQRVNEFGVRMALGAAPGDVLGLVLGRGARLVGLGIAIGFGGAAALTRYLGSLLFGVAPRDPLTLAAVVGILAAAALVACYVPARRATATDPLAALRCE